MNHGKLKYYDKGPSAYKNQMRQSDIENHALILFFRSKAAL